jgi:hypothetical protein
MYSKDDTVMRVRAFSMVRVIDRYPFFSNVSDEWVPSESILSADSSKFGQTEEKICQMVSLSIGPHLDEKTVRTD